MSPFRCPAKRLRWLDRRLPKTGDRRSRWRKRGGDIPRHANDAPGDRRQRVRHTHSSRATESAVGDPTPCLAGGNIVVFDGQSGDYIHPTDDTITQGTWQPKYSSTDIELDFYPLITSQGESYRFAFSSAKLDEPLMKKTYLYAQRFMTETPGHPGLEITAYGKGCNKIDGKFQIHDLEAQDLQSAGVCTLTKITVTFEQSCDAGSPLKGCLHYQP